MLLAVQMAPFALQMKRPVQTATGEVARIAGVHIRVEGGGRSGVGEATPIPQRSAETVEQVLARLGPVASKGVPAPSTLEDIEAVLEMLPSDAPVARYGLELALLDWLAQGHEVPVSRLLNAASRSEVRVNAFLDGSDEHLIEQADRASAAGFETVKLKLGARPLDVDLERVRAVRQRLGSEIRIRVDANGSWSEPMAERALQALSGFQVELCEQPVPSEQLEALERLSRRSMCSLAADESVPRLLRQSRPKVVPIWVLKPSAMGGLIASWKAAQRAQREGTKCFVTAGWEGAVARTGALHLAAALPSADLAHGLDTGAWVEGGEANPRPEQGRLRIPEVPGLGMELR